MWLDSKTLRLNMSSIKIIPSHNYELRIDKQYIVRNGCKVNYNKNNG